MNALLILGFGGAGFLLLCILWGVVGSDRVVRQPRFVSPMTPLHFGVPYEAIELKTDDGLALSSWWLKRPNARGVLLMQHGMGASKADLLDVALTLYARGKFHILMTDFRAHGASEGELISYGHREVLDVKAALDFTERHPELGALPVAYYGISMGGAVGIFSAVRFPRIQALVTDSTYANLSRAIARIQWLTYHIPKVPFTRILLWGTEARLKTSIQDLDPESVIGQVTCGKFFIHGLKDLSIVPGEADLLYAAARGRKTLWKVPEAEHVSAFFLNKEEYARRVLEFVDGEFRREA